MAEILHQLRLLVYPTIYSVFLFHPRWLFRISEPSTVELVKHHQPNKHKLGDVLYQP